MRMDFDQPDVLGSTKEFRHSLSKTARHPAKALIFVESLPASAALFSILGELGISSLAARTDLSFWENARQATPDVIFADAKHLVSRGNLDRTGSNAQGAIVIACARRDDTNSIIRALRCGAEDYLVTPFDKSVLGAKLKCLGLCPR